MYKLLIDGDVVPVTFSGGNNGYVGVHNAQGIFGEVTMRHYQAEDFTLTFIECKADQTSTIEVLHDMILPRAYIVMSGSASKFIIEGIRLPLKAYQFGLFYSSHGNRAIYLPKEESCMYCIIQFSPGFLRQAVPTNLALAPFYVNTVSRKRYVGSPLYCTGAMQEQLEYFREINQQPPSSRMEGLSVKIASYLLEAFAAFCQSEYRGREKGGNLERAIQQAAEFIRHDPGAAHSLYLLSRQVGVSASSLKRGFQQLYGIPMSHYLGMTRLNEAVGLLIQSKLTEELIAERCGYSGSDALIKAFRRRFGCTPGSIR